MKKKLLTQEWFDKLRKELIDLEEVQIPDVQSIIQEAQEAWDLSENSDYHAAKDKLALMQTRVSQLKEMLKDVEIVEKEDISADTIVRYQSEVVLEMDDGKIFHCKIVWSWEVDIFSEPQKISFESPIGAAIEGHKQGDVVTIKLDGSKKQIQIVSVK